jgi:cyclic pyranopterin phosphate synthase
MLKDVNDRQILDLVTYFKGRKPILRFIEYMDVGTCNHWSREAVIPASHVAGLINTVFPIRPAKAQYFGEVASRYEYLDGSGEVGFIPSVTQPFCRSCTRARLSADGKLYTCLFAADGLDLRGLLRQETSDEDLLTLLRANWQKREDRYSELRSQKKTAPQMLPKIEMFRIGG